MTATTSIHGIRSTRRLAFILAAAASGVELGTSRRYSCTAGEYGLGLFRAFGLA
jgi:hypothetical protein